MVAVLKAWHPEVLRPGDAVVCAAEVGGVGAGNIGEFLEFSRSPPLAGTAKVAFLHPSSGRASVVVAKAADLVKCLAQFEPGELVTWASGADDGVPRGAVGSVMGYNERGRVRVRFALGTWNFLPRSCARRATRA